MIQQYTRVMLCLPQTNPNEAFAIFDVMKYLRGQSSHRVAVKGFTCSTPSDPGFLGYWWSKTEKQWLPPEYVVMFIIDYQTMMDSPELQHALWELEQAIHRIYKDNNSAQEEVWITQQRLIRTVPREVAQASDDEKRVPPS